MEFNFDGKKTLNEDGRVKQYTLEIKQRDYRCECGCDVFTQFEELYNDETIYECNGCHSYFRIN